MTEYTNYNDFYTVEHFEDLYPGLPPVAHEILARRANERLSQLFDVLDSMSLSERFGVEPADIDPDLNIIH